ncbi:MAG: hypothetical protein Q9220_000415 [cf. Caloplaca sp. 1 TL-2023]
MSAIADHNIGYRFGRTHKKVSNTGCFNGGIVVVREKTSGRTCVEKKFKDEDIRNRTADFEMQLLSMLRHPNVVKYIAGFIDASHKGHPKASMYLEYCDLGNLHTFIQNRRRLRSPIGEKWVWNIFMQLVNAVAYLQYGIQDAVHGSDRPKGWDGILHRDIKPDNIFLASSGDSPAFRVVLGDFGQGFKMHDASCRKWGRQYMGGNMMTSPPEVDQGGIKAYSFAGDAWAVGATMWTLCWMGEGDKRYFGNAAPFYSSSLNAAIQILMRKKPEERPKLYVFAAQMPAMMEHGLAERRSWHY